jgi:hypothetical protein
LALGPHAAKHLVLDLDQVARIEEIAIDKSGISYVLRMRIGGAALFERALLGIGFGRASDCAL